MIAFLLGAVFGAVALWLTWAIPDYLDFRRDAEARNAWLAAEAKRRGVDSWPANDDGGAQ